MKTVSGVVISSKPVSLSKAAKILSKFSAADNGATPAYAYYLNRASESFNELVQLHKELRGANSERTSKRHRSGTGDEDEGPVASVQNYRKDDEVEEKYVEIPKEIKDPKKKKKRRNGVDNGDELRIHEKLGNVENGVGGKKREKEAKKVKNHVIENGGSNGALNEVQIDNDVKNEEIGRKRKKKMKNESVEENREEKKESKKRKSEEMASGNGEVNDSAEKLQKKRKKSRE